MSQVITAVLTGVATVRVVSVDLWREHLLSAGIIDRGGKNPRQDFKRLRLGLQDKGAIRAWSDHVWLVENSRP